MCRCSRPSCVFVRKVFRVAIFMNLSLELRRRWCRTEDCHHVCLIVCVFFRYCRSWIPSILKSFLEDRGVLLAGRRDGTICALSSDLGTIFGYWTVHGCGGVWCLAIDEQNGKVAFGCGRGRVSLLDLQLETEQRIDLCGDSEYGYIRCLEFVFDGVFLLAAVEGSASRVWAIRVMDVTVVRVVELSFGSILAMICLLYDPLMNMDAELVFGTETGVLCRLRLGWEGVSLCLSQKKIVLSL